MPSPRRTLTTLFLIVFTDLVGFGIVIPLLPLYAEHFHPAPGLRAPNGCVLGDAVSCSPLFSAGSRIGSADVRCF